MLKWFCREICIFTTLRLKSEGWSRKRTLKAAIWCEICCCAAWTSPFSVQIEIFLYREKETPLTDTEFNRSLSPCLTPGHMFAKITSQVREQCRCLPTILLILQTRQFWCLFCCSQLSQTASNRKEQGSGYISQLSFKSHRMVLELKRLLKEWVSSHKHGLEKQIFPYLPFFGTVLILLFLHKRRTITAYFSDPSLCCKML